MVWFFALGEDRRRCETRLAEDGAGYELVITDSAGEHVERFDTLPNLLSREHEVIAAWRAQGWREATIKRPA